MECNQICHYNSPSDGCTVKERGGRCPLANIVLAEPEILVKTGDLLDRNGADFVVVIADENIFVVCPFKRGVIKYSRPAIYSNHRSINTLKELGFDKL